jgi:hypothetical protein
MGCDNTRGKIRVERWEIGEFRFKIKHAIDDELMPIIANKVQGVIEPTMLEVGREGNSQAVEGASEKCAVRK